MGKSNKFDYSKRANSAVKLGEIISRDLQKEVDRAAKDAEKARKARKQSTGSSSGSALGSSPRDTAVHTIDLQVPSKSLGDEGACAMASGLEIALREGCIQLEDINLSNNGITTVSLARLAPIITLARHDLKTLNLSGNSIKVNTVEEAVQWEQFLRAFKDCFTLRRLDLSVNNIGGIAFEIMAKVHMSEPLINSMPYRGQNSVVSLNFEEELTAYTGACSSTDRMTRGGYIKRRSGLRSIPYITITDVDLNDLSALWLSFILEEHHYPNQLIDGLNATLASSTIPTYQQNNNFRGIDWNMKHPDVNRDGLYLLQKTENFREQMLLAEEDGLDGEGYLLKLHKAEDQSIRSRAGDRRVSRAAPGDRRGSIRSIRTADGGEHELSELESARKRLQRSLITNHGACKVELWRTALRLVISSRVLMGIGPDTRTLYIGPPKFDFTSYSPSPVAENKVSAPRPVTPCRLSYDTGLSPSTSALQGTYAATLTAKCGALPGGPELAITVTNTPRTPKIFKPHRKGAFSEGSDLHNVTQKLDSLVVHDRNPQRFVRWQEQYQRKHGSTDFRNDKIPSHLPDTVVELIAGFTVTGREKRLLSDRQMQTTLGWGRRRTNLETEKEWRKMADSSQVWTLLESIGCLTYNQRQ